MTEEYSLAISETLSIINSATIEEKNKIPKSFMNFLIKNANPNYNPIFDPKIAIKDLNLRAETKGLLSLIYTSYLSNDQEKIEFNKILKANQEKVDQEKRQQYDVYKVFDERKNRSFDNESDTQSEKLDNTEANIVQYKKETIFSKIIKIIKNIFKRR